MKDMPDFVLLDLSIKDTYESLEALFRLEDLMVLDTETTGLDSYLGDKPFLMQIAFGSRPMQVFLIPLMSYGNHHGMQEVQNPEAVKEAVKKLLMIFLEREKTTLVAHNLKFDMHMLFNYLALPYTKTTEIKSEFIDTMVVARVIRNDLNSYSLASLSNEFKLTYGKDDKLTEYFESAKIAKTRRKYNEVPNTIMNNYSGYDIIATYDLLIALMTEGQRLAKQVCSGQDLNEVLKLEALVTKVLFFMERRGITIDVEHLKNCHKYYNDKVNELEFMYMLETGETEFIDSAKALEAPLKRVGLNLYKTPDGKLSASATVLERLNHPLAKLITELREHKKVLSTYIDSISSLVDKDNKIHANFVQCGANTLRMSCNNPNLQNFPRATEPSFDVRGVVTAGEGKVLLSVDFAAQELRAVLDLANEKKYIEMVEKGVDLHEYNAKYIGCERFAAKGAIFGKLYGSGPATTAANLGITEFKARNIHDGLDDAMPNVKAFTNSLTAMAQARGYIKTAYGNPLNITFNHYRALNQMIQGTCAIMTKKALVAWDALACKYNDMYPLIAIHDEIVCEVKDQALALKNKNEFLACFRNSYVAKNKLEMDAEYSKFMLKWEKC